MIAKSRSGKSVLVLPTLSPIALCVVVSSTVNETTPSPDAIARVEIAPAFQPAAPVFVSWLPDTDTPVAAVHVTASPAAAVHVTASPRLPASTTSKTTAPGVKSDVSTSNGYAGATRLV